jgi:hypothetical protein
METGLCLFCGDRPADTNEHVIADWIPKYMGLQEIVIERPSRTKVERRWKTKASFELKLKICDRCNSTWSSRLENQVKPILLPMLKGFTSTKISGEDVQVLTRWLWKIAMLHEHMDQVVSPKTFTPSDRWDLMNGTPPEGMAWLGRFADMADVQLRSNRLVFGCPPDVRPPTGMVHTMTLGNVAAQLLLLRDVPLNHVVALPNDALAGGLAARLQPFEGGFDYTPWPPPFAFMQLGIEQWHDRLARTRHPLLPKADLKTLPCIHYPR